MEDNLAQYPRIFIDVPLRVGEEVELTDSAAKHVQVLRMQPQQHIYLFNGLGGQWLAKIVDMGRNHVKVSVVLHHDLEREALIQVTLLIGIPANERMDFVIEKATELGVAHIYPLMFSRSVVKLSAERAIKKNAHWNAIAVAACEQCGRNRIPIIHPVMSLLNMIKNELDELPKERRVLSFHPHAQPWGRAKQGSAICVLSGPEGGMTEDEEALLMTQAQFLPYSLGGRVLRADTAPLAALSTLVL